MKSQLKLQEICYRLSCIKGVDYVKYNNKFVMLQNEQDIVKALNTYNTIYPMSELYDDLFYTNRNNQVNVKKWETEEIIEVFPKKYL